MPLRATLDNEDVLAFDFSPDKWAKLKGSYKKNCTLTLPCCGHNAIPKTSKLKTQFFTHARGANCAAVSETKEHLQLKTLIAKAAKDAGWKVITEYRGMTPDGEEWIADVYCEHLNAKVAFEIQWSHQTQDEYMRRTEKYKRSGVRCAWFFRLGKREYNSVNSHESESLPYFGFRQVDDGWVVSRYNEKLESFVRNMLIGRLEWSPKLGKPISAQLGYCEVPCWKCDKSTRIITRLEFDYGNSGRYLKVFNFINDNVPEWIAKYIPDDFLTEHHIGQVKRRQNLGGNYQYTNGCVHCDAIFGNFYSKRKAGKIFYIPFNWNYEECKLTFEAGWYYKGYIGKDIY
ncbi:competence protein CoiA [Vibrio sp. YYF0003]|uniref:competence protein CoiA n=1 Tax=Vibrio sp. YYF0003 TaxID=3116646 RepID=UPI002EA27616|nr:competence protein CoiA family protein [Vibrio sp. YYF0003]